MDIVDECIFCKGEVKDDVCTVCYSEQEDPYVPGKMGICEIGAAKDLVK